MSRFPYNVESKLLELYDVKINKERFLTTLVQNL